VDTRVAVVARPEGGCGDRQEGQPVVLVELAAEEAQGPVLELHRQVEDVVVSHAGCVGIAPRDLEPHDVLQAARRVQRPASVVAREIGGHLLDPSVADLDRRHDLRAVLAMGQRSVQHVERWQVRRPFHVRPVGIIRIVRARAGGQRHVHRGVLLDQGRATDLLGEVHERGAAGPGVAGIGLRERAVVVCVHDAGPTGRVVVDVDHVEQRPVAGARRPARAHGPPVDDAVRHDARVDHRSALCASASVITAE
jgi:hypothetical protein